MLLENGYQLLRFRRQLRFIGFRQQHHGLSGFRERLLYRRFLSPWNKHRLAPRVEDSRGPCRAVDDQPIRRSEIDARSASNASEAPAAQNAPARLDSCNPK